MSAKAPQQRHPSKAADMLSAKISDKPGADSIAAAVGMSGNRQCKTSDRRQTKYQVPPATLQSSTHCRWVISVREAINVTLKHPTSTSMGLRVQNVMQRSAEHHFCRIWLL